MKKMILVLVIALAVAAGGWAQSAAQSYTVQEINGRVEREARKGKWEAIKTGETLKADTVIRTVIGAKLILKSGDTIYTVDPVKNGKLADLVKSGTAIQIQGKVSQTDTGSASRATGRISTASARADDAEGEVEGEVEIED